MAISTPQISVILAVFNQERFIPGLLSSLKAQDCSASFEVIICDDGSSDATRELAFAGQRSLGLDLRYIWQPDRGFNLSRSRNNGVRCAQGEVLVFLDGDSWLRPFFLRDHWDAHQTGCRLVCGAVQTMSLFEDQYRQDYASLLREIPESVSTNMEALRYWFDSVRPWMACTGGNLSVKREHIVLFDEEFQGWGSEDRDFAFRLYDAGLTIYLLRRTGLAQLRIKNQSVDWNPCKGGDQTSIISALKSKLHLYRKYPGELMTPSLDLVRYSRLNEATDAWELGELREDVSVVEILDQFERWSQCHRTEPASEGLLVGYSNGASE